VLGTHRPSTIEARKRCWRCSHGLGIRAGSLLLIVLAVVGLVELIRTGDTMETWQVVVWAVLIVLVPVIGLVVFLFWRLSRSEAMQDAIDFHDQ
jgi:hypothetical protein